MPVLIDGNNLIHALGGVGDDASRVHLCTLLAGLARGGEKVTVAFDGPPASSAAAERIAEFAMEVLYSGHGRSADAIITKLIAATTAPRLLKVVTTDREIRAAARKRRCPTTTSEQFARVLTRTAAAKAPGQSEPPEKRHGLSAAQTDAWLRVFGFDQPKKP